MRRLPVGVRTLNRSEPGSAPAGYQRIGIEPLGITLGAVVTGVDLSEPLDDELFADVDTAFKEWKVIVFRDQDITLDQQGAFASRWGKVVEDSLPRQVANGGFCSRPRNIASALSNHRLRLRVRSASESCIDWGTPSSKTTGSTSTAREINSGCALASEPIAVAPAE